MGFGRPPGTENITGPLGQALDAAVASAQVNQIRGVSVATSIGSGIPKPVTDVAVSVSNASAGSTCVVKITYRRDPGDTYFNSAQVFVRGYQGNNQNVAFASGTDSPITFVLNNTGESIVITVQALGNSGSVPLASCPTTGLRLPQSTSGGFGPGSNPGVKGSGTAGALAVWSSATSIGAGNLTGDTVTSGSTSSIVQRIQTVPVSNAVPNTGDILRYNLYNDSKWDIASGMGRFIQLRADVTAGPTCDGHGEQPGVIGTVGNIGSTGTESPARSYTTGAVASVNIGAALRWGFGANLGQDAMSYGPLRRFSMRLMMNHSANVRYWLGLADGKTSDLSPDATWATDTPNRIFAAFRFSAGTDSVIQAVTSLSSAAQTITGTGVAVNTSNSKLFEIVPTPSAFKFFVDGALVATNTTNTPATTDRCGMYFTVDNKNSANAVGATFYNAMMTLK